MAPCQHVGFGQAMRILGYRALYLWNDDGGVGLALTRGLFPGVGRVTGRANLFAPGADRRFVAGAIRELGRHGIPFVKVGDSMWGLDWSDLSPDWPFPRTSILKRHTFRLDLAEDVETLLKRQEATVRAHVRKAEREGVSVREVRGVAELDAYCELAGVTTARARSVSAYTDFPARFFHALHAQLTPTGAARLYLAWHGETPLAGCIVVCSESDALYFAGASTRDRRWTHLQGSTAVLWHAICDAKRRGQRQFDLGGCTPTEDRDHPRYGVYAFKKSWGGQLAMFYNLEVVLGPARHFLQERVVSPLWDRAHPAYFRLLQVFRRWVR